MRINAQTDNNKKTLIMFYIQSLQKDMISNLESMYLDDKRIDMISTMSNWYL